MMFNEYNERKKTIKKRGDLNGVYIMSCNRMYPFNIITGG